MSKTAPSKPGAQLLADVALVPAQLREHISQACHFGARAQGVEPVPRGEKGALDL